MRVVFVPRSVEIQPLFLDLTVSGGVNARPAEGPLPRLFVCVRKVFEGSRATWVGQLNAFWFARNWETQVSF